MSTPRPTTDHRRFRLASNDNETIVADDESDVEGHRLASNDNETIVEGVSPTDGDAPGQELDPSA